MKPHETTLIEPADGAQHSPGGNHQQKSFNGGKKRGPGGLSGDARRVAQSAAALEQRIRIAEEKFRKTLERIWIILRIVTAGMIFSVLRDSRLITDEDRRWLVEEAGAPKSILTKGDIAA